MTTFRRGLIQALLTLVLVCLNGISLSGRTDTAADPANVTADPKLFDGLEYRSLGFSRGGRSTAVAGVPGQPLTYYFGSTGGGVWKTLDAGITWSPVSDEFFEAGSVGAIAVADSDPNVVYVGTGSACPRGNISPGVGVYKSTDSGKTWKHIGLRDAGLIGRIRVHPKDHNLVYVAALGRIFGPNDQRGVYRSRDGGETWEKVLFISNRTGAVDLSMNPHNPREIYAAMWTAERKPWTLISGSEESGLYKTTDGGDNWTRLEKGLPRGVVGRIGVAVSPARPARVWALVEAGDHRGGIYRSEDSGESWRKINGERRFLQRAWYYIHIHADPKDADTVYVLNVGFFRSSDGGRSFQTYRTPHGDNHDLWINPDDPDIMINANDGGANVSFNGGRSWSEQMNQPTAEFYRVTVDNQYPYRVYGAQQDNSTASVSSREGGRFGESQGFYSVGGCESGHIAVDPRNPHIVYAGCYGGAITRVDTRTRLSRSIRTYPEASTGQRAADMKYRFQWNAPIRISPHDSDVVYHTSQYVHRTRDGGQSWEIISPDLTRNDKSKQDYSGGPVSRDNTGVEVFGTVFAFEESPLTPGLLWAGSDDGLVHVSRDNGKTWKNITPGEMPDSGTVNMIELSRHDAGRAFIAVHRYREQDFRPYIFRTSDYGQTWSLLTTGKNGIPEDHFVRVVREDPDRRGLLYVGTEFGMYVSFDDGAHWQSFRQKLPITPITDLAVHQKDLVVATQGRGFYVLDDLSPLHQLNDSVAKSKAHLYAPSEAVRAPGSSATIYYYLSETPKDAVTLEFLDGRGRVVQTVGTRRAGAEEAEQPSEEAEEGRRGGRAPVLTVRAGLNRYTWNLAVSPLFRVPPRIVMWGGGGVSGPKAVPGSYQVRLKIGDWSQTQPLRIQKDPRVDTPQAHYQEQFDLSTKVGEKIRELYGALLRLRDTRTQANEIGERIKKAGLGEEPLEAAKSLGEKLRQIEGELTQLQGEGGQDALNFPGRLDNQFVTLYGEVASGDTRPTAGAHARFEELKPELSGLLTRLKQVFDTDLARFNDLVRQKKVPPVIPAATAAP